MTIDLAHLGQWIGRQEQREERISPFPSNALSLTLNRPDPPYGDGDPLPPLWHWLHFLPLSALSDAGPDGHPARGGFLPPVPLPRRMWAGSRLNFHRPLLIGATYTRTSRVTKVEHKTGRAGDLVFVTVAHSIEDRDGVALSEEHDIVYRDLPAPGAAAPVVAPSQDMRAEWRRTITPDAVLLFRYSALTFNSHRIHYDLDHTTRVEGYPGLVVHGPLIATLLLDALRHAHPRRRVQSFQFRALGPTFHTDAFTVAGLLTGPAAAKLWAEKANGLTMEAVATLDQETDTGTTP